MKPPEQFELKHLRLRRPREDDADAIFEYASDPEVTRYMDWPTCKGTDEIANRLRARITSKHGGSECYWIITEHGQDRAIGSVVAHLRNESAEIGFLVNRRYWGRGHATEAGQAVIGWLFSLSSVKTIWATCDVENTVSARVLEKLGMTRLEIMPHSIVRPNLSSEPRDSYKYVLMKAAA